MIQMREKSLFSWQHSLIGFNGTSKCLSNMRSWNEHLEHFFSDKEYSSYSSLLCFTDIPSVLEILPVVLEIEKKAFLLVLVYCMPGPLGTFTDGFILTINELPTEYRIMIFGNFNLNQMLSENGNVEPLIQNFDLSQRIQYLIHIHGGILNLVLDASNSDAVASLPLSCSDHFVLFSISEEE